MKIITTPDARLREKSEKVRKIDDEILGIIADMRKLSLDWEKEHPYELSAAMAAPQMGVNKRIIIIWINQYPIAFDNIFHPANILCNYRKPRRHGF